MRMNADTPPFFEPSEEELKEMEMGRTMYNELMGLVMSMADYWLRPQLMELRELPETEELEYLKTDMERYLQAPHIPPAKNPGRLLYKYGVLLAMARKFVSKVPKKTKTSNQPAETDELKEIIPENKPHSRAMILLRALKLNPDRALHTEACKMLLESAEGVVMQAAIIRRAMENLAATYEGKVIYEKKDGSYRIRIDI